MNDTNVRVFRAFLIAALPVALSACKAVVLQPSGDVALQQRDLLVVSTLLMLVIIIPVMCLTVWFAWHYRRTNTEATYEPEWDHSTKLELVIWSAPLLIIICLGALTWMGSHLLDPYRPLDRVARDTVVDKSVAPLDVDVVAMDWKWLFIYPQYGIASVNTMAAPTNRPIAFHITASSVMNSFYIPALAGQIYAMPGMETTLHAVMNHDGDYEGFSANYSGSGFSRMRFVFQSMSDEAFNAWVAQAQASGTVLDRARYLQLEVPSEGNPPEIFGKVDTGLYHAILNMCVPEGSVCMDAMMAKDMGMRGPAAAMEKGMLKAPNGVSATPATHGMGYMPMDMNMDMQGAGHADHAE